MGPNLADVGGTFTVLVVVALVVAVFSGAIPAAWLAAEKGRSPFTWLLVGLLIGPMAVVLVGFAPLVPDNAYGECPECHEGVRLDARRCPHCRVAYQRPQRSTVGIAVPALSPDERALLGI